MLSYISTNYKAIMSSEWTDKTNGEVIGILLALLLMFVIAGCQNLDVSLEEVVTEDSIVVAGEIGSPGVSNRIFSCADGSLPDVTYGLGIPVKGISSFISEGLKIQTENVKEPMVSVKETVKAAEKEALATTDDIVVSDDLVTDSGIVEEKEQQDDTIEEINQPVLCHGFLCDTTGMIIGCDSVSVVDGVLCLPSDGTCTGVSTGALASLGSDVFEIYIPANITLIEPGAFEGLTELFYIEVHPDNPVYGSSCGTLYEK